MICTVINIGTGYLNRPNWLLAGYSVYHRVASQGFPGQPGSQPTMLWQARDLGTRDGACGTPTMFMTGPRPRSRHQQRCVRDARRDATDFEFFISFYCKTTIGQGLSNSLVYPRCAILQQGMHMKVFSKVYIVTGCIFCAPSGLWQGQVLNPSGTPLPIWEVSAPPPPPGGGGMQTRSNLISSSTKYAD